ncbi:MAG: hypothetical protein V2B13_04780 [Pseudomonadota bacterium]
MSRDREIGFVAPEDWDEYRLCKRQLSWYRISPFRHQVLVVSSFGLEDYQLQPETIIRNSTFRPRLFPGREEQLGLINRESYQKSRPDEWEDIAGEDQEQQKRWLKIMGLGHKRYEELFISHCANHANFIEPAYYSLEEDQRVPYSIGRTPYICSACLEFYNIVGTKAKKKYVVPCPGAVLFAGMGPNHYYEVWHP